MDGDNYHTELDGTWVAIVLDGDEEYAPIYGPFETYEECQNWCNNNTKHATIDSLRSPIQE